MLGMLLTLLALVSPGGAQSAAPPAGAGAASSNSSLHGGASSGPLAQPELTDRLINLPTHKSLSPGTLQVIFTHRFSQTVDDGGFQDLWGLDSSADIGIGAGLGLGRGLEVELYRSSFFKQWEAALRWSLARQGGALPVGLAVRAGGSYRSADNIDDRSTGFAQLIVSRRIGGHLDVSLIPMFASDTPTLTNAVNIGASLAWHLPRRWGVYAEVIAPNDDVDGADPAWAVGLDKRVGGHAFLLYLGTSRATATDLLVGGDLPGGFDAGDVRLGFNIIRRFPE